MHFGMGFLHGARVRVRPLGVTISGAISRHALSYALTKRRGAPH